MSAINKKLDRIYNHLLLLKSDTSEIKRRLDCPSKQVGLIKLPVNLPMKNLSDIEEMEVFLKKSEENKQHYVRNSIFFRAL